MFNTFSKASWISRVPKNPMGKKKNVPKSLFFLGVFVFTHSQTPSYRYPSSHFSKAKRHWAHTGGCGHFNIGTDVFDERGGALLGDHCSSVAVFLLFWSGFS